ncbi:hypothetical protein I5U11_14455 [Stenotrophomonas maltophilia]|uniref:hypothetical protein n=1 Tax=Stenotrophomonas TaxID=40323 RepID=UPI00117FD23F|nr:MULTISPECIES: hypothetical protein [Stenotrophomonas]MBB1135713.1 hypothetical protein [Stenotrophomonas sp. I18B00994]MBH1559713.1 hypothetical protein [Stenotrophomonas maltophilia]
MDAITIWCLAIGIGCAASAVFYISIRRWMKSVEHPATEPEIVIRPKLKEDPDGNRLSCSIFQDDVNAFKSLVTDNPTLAQHYNFYRVGKSGIETCSTLNRIVECAAPHMIEKNKEMLSFALECGADINARSPDDGRTPLEEAIYRDKFFLIPFLIRNGARQVEGPRADALTNVPIVLWTFYQYSGGGFRCTDMELVDLVDAFASIGLEKKELQLPGSETLDAQDIKIIADDCRQSFLNLVAQVDAAKAKKEKHILLCELAVATEDAEVRPKRRM